MMRIFFAAASAFGLIGASAALGAERTVTLAVENMTCAACPHIVKGSLAAVPGVSNVEISVADKTATVTYDDSVTAIPSLVGATTNAGYPSAPRS